MPGPGYEISKEAVEYAKRAMAELQKARDLCKRAQAAGLDVEAQDRYCQALGKRIDAFLAEFDRPEG